MLVHKECEAVSELLPNAGLVMFEESGHMPFIEEQEKFVKVMRDFLEWTNSSGVESR